MKFDIQHGVPKRDGENHYRTIATVFDVTDAGKPPKYIGSGYVVWSDKPSPDELKEAVDAEAQRHIESYGG